MADLYQHRARIPSHVASIAHLNTALRLISDFCSRSGERAADPSQSSTAFVKSSPLPLPSPPNWGAHLCTFLGGTGIAEGFEPGEPVAHGDGPGRTFRGVPFPATKASDDPA